MGNVSGGCTEDLCVCLCTFTAQPNCLLTSLPRASSSLWPSNTDTIAVSTLLFPLIISFLDLHSHYTHESICTHTHTYTHILITSYPSLITVRKSFLQCCSVHLLTHCNPPFLPLSFLVFPPLFPFLSAHTSNVSTSASSVSTSLLTVFVSPL